MANGTDAPVIEKNTPAQETASSPDFDRDVGADATTSISSNTTPCQQFRHLLPLRMALTDDALNKLKDGTSPKPLANDPGSSPDYEPRRLRQGYVYIHYQVGCDDKPLASDESGRWFIYRHRTVWDDQAQGNDALDKDCMASYQFQQLTWDRRACDPGSAEGQGIDGFAVKSPTSYGDFKCPELVGAQSHIALHKDIILIDIAYSEEQWSGALLARLERDAELRGKFMKTVTLDAGQNIRPLPSLDAVSDDFNPQSLPVLMQLSNLYRYASVGYDAHAPMPPFKQAEKTDCVILLEDECAALRDACQFHLQAVADLAAMFARYKYPFVTAQAVDQLRQAKYLQENDWADAKDPRLSEDAAQEYEDYIKPSPLGQLTPIAERIKKDFEIDGLPPCEQLLDLFPKLPEYCEKRRIEPIAKACAGFIRASHTAAQIEALGKACLDLGISDYQGPPMKTPAMGAMCAFNELGEHLYFLINQLFSGLGESESGKKKLHGLLGLSEDGSEPVDISTPVQAAWLISETMANISQVINLKLYHLSVYITETLRYTDPRMYISGMWAVHDRSVSTQSSRTQHDVSLDDAGDMDDIKNKGTTRRIQHSSKLSLHRMSFWHYVQQIFLSPHFKDPNYWRLLKQRATWGQFFAGLTAQGKRVFKALLAIEVDYLPKVSRASTPAIHESASHNVERIEHAAEGATRKIAYAAKGVTLSVGVIGIMLVLQDDSSEDAYSLWQRIFGNRYLQLGHNLVGYMDFSQMALPNVDKTVSRLNRASTAEIQAEIEVAESRIATAKTLRHRVLSTVKTVGFAAGVLSALMGLAQWREGYLRDDSMMQYSGMAATASGVFFALVGILPFAMGIAIAFAVMAFIFGLFVRNAVEDWIFYGFWGTSPRYWGESEKSKSDPDYKSGIVFWSADRPEKEYDDQFNTAIYYKDVDKYGDPEENFAIEMLRFINVTGSMEITDKIPHDNAIEIAFNGFAFAATQGGIDPAQVAVHLHANILAGWKEEIGGGHFETETRQYQFSLAEAGITQIDAQANEPVTVPIPESVLSQLKADVNKTTRTYDTRGVGLSPEQEQQKKKRTTQLIFSVRLPFYERKSGDIEAQSKIMFYSGVIDDD